MRASAAVELQQQKAEGLAGVSEAEQQQSSSSADAAAAAPVKKRGPKSAKGKAAPSEPSLPQQHPAQGVEAATPAASAVAEVTATRRSDSSGEAGTSRWDRRVAAVLAVQIDDD